MRLGIFTTFHWIKIPSCRRPPRSRPLPSHPHHHAKTPREKHSARRFASIQQKDQLAARRLTLDSASTVSFLSVAFSSSSVFWSIPAQSLRPSCFAHAIRLP